MTSKKLTGSPLSHLISQWSQQPSEQRRNYRILLQCNTTLHARLQTLQDVSNPQVYRRAGLRTPSETSTRDILGGTAWMVRLVELGIQANCRVVFVKTQPKPCFLSQELQTKITIVDASHDPWGWDDEEGPSIRNLSGLVKEIRKQTTMSSSTTDLPVMLVWESLTPLLLVHGLERTLRLLNLVNKPAGCLQIWYSRVETLMATQHATLEDAAQALLNLNGGEMTLVRQGIRESGNIVREVLPFQLVVGEDNGSLSCQLKEQLDTPSEKLDDEPHLVDEPTSSATESGAVSSSRKTGKTSGSGRPKIQLKLEDDEDKAKENEAAPPPLSRPKIFLQDDDPEFDDLDEEDPDDDLDI